jgi:hypothetical protein
LVRIECERPAQELLSRGAVAAEQARQLDEQGALGGQDVWIVGRELQGALQDAPEPVQPEQAARAAARQAQPLAEIADDAEMRRGVGRVGSRRRLGQREAALEQVRFRAVRRLVCIGAEPQRLRRARRPARLGEGPQRHDEQRDDEQDDAHGGGGSRRRFAGAIVVPCTLDAVRR